MYSLITIYLKQANHQHLQSNNEDSSFYMTKVAQIYNSSDYTIIPYSDYTTHDFHVNI